MIPARPALANAVHPAYVNHGTGRRANLSGQVNVEVEAFPGRRPPRKARGGLIQGGAVVNRAGIRAAFRSAAHRSPRHVPLRSHGRPVPWAPADAGAYRDPWAMVGEHKTGDLDARTAGRFGVLAVLSALARTRAGIRGLNAKRSGFGIWFSEITRRAEIRPLWAPLERLLTALAAVVAAGLPFLAWWLPRRDDTPGGRHSRAALLRFASAPTRGPDRRSQRRPSVRVGVA
jgi:hypothetical protein